MFSPWATLGCVYASSRYISGTKSHAEGKYSGRILESSKKWNFVLLIGHFWTSSQPGLVCLGWPRKEFHDRMLKLVRWCEPSLEGLSKELCYVFNMAFNSWDEAFPSTTFTLGLSINCQHRTCSKPISICFSRSKLYSLSKISLFNTHHKLEQNHQNWGHWLNQG